MKTKTTKQTIQDFIDNPNAKDFAKIKDDHVIINVLPVKYIYINEYKSFDSMFCIQQYLNPDDSPENREKRCLFLEKMFDLCVTEDHFISVYEADTEKLFSDKIKDSLIKLGNTPVVWMERLKSYSKRNSQVREFLIDNLFVVCKFYTEVFIGKNAQISFGQLFTIDGLSDRNKGQIIREAEKIAFTLQDKLDLMVWVLKLIDTNSEYILNSFYNDIKSFAQSFEDWVLIYESLKNYTDNSYAGVLFVLSITQMKKFFRN